MRRGIARRTRWRAGRASPRDDERRRKLPASSVEWAGPSRRARAVAVLVAVAFAAITFAVVSRVWRQAAPPPRPVKVEVKLVPTPPSPSPHLPAR